MRARSPVVASFEISTHNPRNLVVVESHRGRVLVRAAQDNFSERRKAFLIRQLAAEGYIPDPFATYTEEEPVSGLTWVIDRSLLAVGPEAVGRTRRFMRTLIAGSLVLLLLELVVVFIKG